MFELPEDLTALSVADLNRLAAEAVTAFTALAPANPDDLTDEQVTEMERLSGAITALTTERDAREAAAADRRARVEAAQAVVQQASTTTPEPPAEEPPAEEEQPQEETPAEETENDEQEEKDSSEGAGDTVTASSKPSVRGLPPTPVVVPKKSSEITITAAAEVPGFATGQPLDDLKDVTKAFIAKANGFPRVPVPNSYIRSNVATFTRTFDDEYVVPESGMSDEAFSDVFNRAGTEQRLNGGSLVAAGGWCAPSETFYDLCVTESMDGLIDLPEVGVRRGGIRFTKGPDFSDIYEDAGFFQTEAQAEAGTTKPCIEVECPEFEEIRLDVSGICVQAPILTRVGYPELVRRWIEGTLVAQAHKESLEVINRMAAVAGAAEVLTGGAGSGFDLLAALEWSALTQKYRWRMRLNATLEAVLPVWAKSIIRSDLALRQSAEPSNISDAQITSFFSARGIRVQWVYDWQPLDTSTEKCVAPVPGSIKALIYPAGTFVKGTADVISLDTVYDSTNLQKNMYIAAFAESGFLVANRCYDACQIEVPTCILGASGGSLDACATILAPDTTP